MEGKKSKYPLNALDDLVRDHDRMLRDLAPSLHFIRQHEETIRQLTSNPMLDEIRRQGEALRQLTTNPVIEGFREQQKLTDQLLQNPVADMLQHYRESARHLTELQSSFDTSSFRALSDHAKEIADAATPWREMARLVQNDFSRLIPDTAFSEVTRIAESFRGAMPVVAGLDAGIVTTNWDATLTAALEHVRERAHHIAENPEADVTDVEKLFEEAAAVATAAPAEARAAMNVYVKMLLFWLLGTLAEDPVKAAAHKALATLLIFLSSLQPVQPPLPAPPPSTSAPKLLPAPDAPADLTLLGDWQVEGLPDIIRRAGPQASLRTLEFFTKHIRNKNTRAAYANAVVRFFDWCDDHGLELADITPFTVTTYIGELGKTASASTVKQHLAAIRRLFDWLVIGQVLPMNPASSVRGPRDVAKRGATPALSADQVRALLNSIDTSDIAGLRDRALIAVMVFTFARVSAAAQMRVEDYYVSGQGRWFRLHEKGGKRHEVPAHHTAKAYMDAYLTAAGIGSDGKAPLFRTIGRDRTLAGNAMHRVDVLRMIKRRAAAAGLPASTCCHTFRATGITAYLQSGGTIEKAQQIAAHESPLTTKVYGHVDDALTLDEIELIAI